MKVLVIGYGSIGRRHIENLYTFSNIDILVCTKRKHDGFLKQKRCRVYDSVDKCIKEKPDAAIIANVTRLHMKTAIKLAKAGINLLIEKPLSDSINGAGILLNETRKHNLITMIGCNFRFNPCIRKIREIISKNQLGRILVVQAENGSYLPNWHPDEKYQTSYAARRNLGGGALLTSIHEIDYLYWFFGNVAEVFSITGQFSDLQISSDDLSIMSMRFKNNVVAQVHLDYFQRPDSRWCKIIGTRGTLYWNNNANEVKMYDIKKHKWITKIKLQNYDNNNMYLDELSHFLECVSKKKQTLNPIYEGIETLKIALAAKYSSKIKKIVALS